MRYGSARAVFASAAAFSLFLMACALPNTPRSVAPSSATHAAARTVLPGTSTAAASLSLPQSTAFAILGHSCGGIQEKSYATGFDPANGLPIGIVYIQTRCGGSGRGGGYHTTTYSAWVGATWDFSGNLVSSAKLAAAPTVDPSFTVTDSYGDSLYNVNTSAYLVVPVPAAPTAVTAVQSGDALQVSWTPKGVNPIAILSSTLTATPNNPTATILTATVTGPAANGMIGPLQPQTTYQVTVAGTTIGGTGAASDPIGVTTAAASLPPSAPASVTARWATADPAGTTDTLIATWSAASPGDSPVDQYLVTIAGGDGAGTLTQTRPGTTLTASFTVDYTPDWSVTVSAHNAAGWGPSSAPITLGGL
jgi:hypothetical protein